MYTDKEMCWIDRLVLNVTLNTTVLFHGSPISLVDKVGTPRRNHRSLVGKQTIKLNKDKSPAQVPYAGFKLTSSVMTG